MIGGKVIFETDLPKLKLHSRGKVRDSWNLEDEKLLIVATDRISAFDVVVGAIPGKGKILNSMSAFWFGQLKSIGRSHFISTVLDDAHNDYVWAQAAANDLPNRCMIVEKVDHVVPIECVVRGYLAGSGWEEYQKTGIVCGNKLPPGLKEGDKLPEPIFTPATKAEAGMHDENITYESMVMVLNNWLWKNDGIRYFAVSLASRLMTKSLAIYEEARDYATGRKIVIADTKFEFGIKNNRLMLIDEILTPDSSRFWPAEDWKPGRSQKSFDKQYLRDYLKSIGWNKKPPAPELPEEVIRVTAEKYSEAAERLLL